MTAPSRQFMIQQATLTAAHDVWGNGFEYLEALLVAAARPNFSGEWFRERVCREYRRISSQYEVRAA